MSQSNPNLTDSLMTFGIFTVIGCLVVGSVGALLDWKETAKILVDTLTLAVAFGALLVALFRIGKAEEQHRENKEQEWERFYRARNEQLVFELVGEFDELFRKPWRYSLESVKAESKLLLRMNTLLGTNLRNIILRLNRAVMENSGPNEHPEMKDVMADTYSARLMTYVRGEVIEKVAIAITLDALSHLTHSIPFAWDIASESGYQQVSLLVETSWTITVNGHTFQPDSDGRKAVGKIEYPLEGRLAVWRLYLNEVWNHIRHTDSKLWPDFISIAEFVEQHRDSEFQISWDSLPAVHQYQRYERYEAEGMITSGSPSRSAILRGLPGPLRRKLSPPENPVGDTNPRQKLTTREKAGEEGFKPLSR